MSDRLSNILKKKNLDFQNFGQDFRNEGKNVSKEMDLDICKKIVPNNIKLKTLYSKKDILIHPTLDYAQKSPF